MKTIIRVYRSRGWRWQMRDARNGKIIGASTEAYMRQAACLNNLERVTGVSLYDTDGDQLLFLHYREWWLV